MRTLFLIIGYCLIPVIMTGFMMLPRFFGYGENPYVIAVFGIIGFQVSLWIIGWIDTKVFGGY